MKKIILLNPGKGKQVTGFRILENFSEIRFLFGIKKN